ncbi:hypothetical protein [Allokutzneria multivorans]
MQPWRHAELMSRANTTFFTELCVRWHRTHTAPPPPFADVAETPR